MAARLGVGDPAAGFQHCHDRRRRLVSVDHRCVDDQHRVRWLFIRVGYAGEVIDTLETLYNKARQAAITQDISEIVGGAAAV